MVPIHCVSALSYLVLQLQCHGTIVLAEPNLGHGGLLRRWW